MRAGAGPASRRARRAARGFTLIELLTVVAIVAILATAAVPGFVELMATQRVRAATTALVESLWVARAEATKRNTDVGFAFNDPQAGWIVPDPAGGPTPILRQAGFGAIEFATPGGEAVRFTFNAYGRLSTGAGWVQIGDVNAGVYRCVAVSPAGRATTTKGPCP